MPTEKKKLTKIARRVLTGLQGENKPMKPEELTNKLGMNLRSVRYGLKLLLEAELVDRYPDLIDLRSYYYAPHKNTGQISPHHHRNIANAEA